MSGLWWRLWGVESLVFRVPRIMVEGSGYGVRFCVEGVGFKGSGFRISGFGI